MKFVSKLNHYRITLRQGLPGNPIMAIPPTSGLYALFTDGQFFTDEEELIALLKKNKQHGQSYFSVEDEAADPFAKNRKSSEPAHAIMEMGQGGTPGKAYSTPAVSKDVALKEAAEALLKSMLPSMIEKIRAEVRAEMTPTEPPVNAQVEPKTVKNKPKQTVAAATESESAASEAK